MLSMLETAKSNCAIVIGRGTHSERQRQPFGQYIYAIVNRKASVTTKRKELMVARVPADVLQHRPSL